MRANKLKWYTSSMPRSSVVAVSQQQQPYGYPVQPPYHPSTRYPEAPFRELGDEPNTVYDAVREAFHLLGYDAERFGTPEWNPLGRIVHPGDQVLIKPNFVRHYNGFGLDVFSVITHAAVIRAVLDYTQISLRGEGRIILGDAPLQSADMVAIRRLTGIDAVLAHFQANARIPVEFVDFRLEAVKTEHGMVVEKQAIADQASDFIAVDLGEQSYLEAVSERYRSFRVTDYQAEAMTAHHQPSKHEYLIPKAVLESDVVINLPKLKTHRKVGITCALKNLVGINGHKDWLPHHSNLSAEEGGDEYLHPSGRKRLDTRLDEAVDRSERRWQKYLLRAGRLALRLSGKVKPFEDPYFEGSWWGNDTLWRTALDLNRILFCADHEGRLKETEQRRVLALVDGIVAGAGEGPLEPTPRLCGLIVAGENPAAVDAACAHLMGFDPQKIPLIREALKAPLFATDEGIEVRSNENRWARLMEISRSETLNFQPAKGWEGHIELE